MHDDVSVWQLQTKVTRLDMQEDWGNGQACRAPTGYVVAFTKGLPWMHDDVGVRQLRTKVTRLNMHGAAARLVGSRLGCRDHHQRPGCARGGVLHVTVSSDGAGHLRRGQWPGL
jgi:hypothetical protein